jgi:hypothetical protein
MTVGTITTEKVLGDGENKILQWRRRVGNEWKRHQHCTQPPRISILIVRPGLQMHKPEKSVPWPERNCLTRYHTIELAEWSKDGG